MNSLTEKLKQRFFDELPFFRLRPWQFILLLLWAAWPWLAQLAFPDNSVLAYGPVVVFLPFAYLVGSMFVAALPSFAPAYAFGFSFTVFFLAYLGLVSWRQRHVR